jgi:PTS system galactitol-specific IIA component
MNTLELLHPELMLLNLEAEDSNQLLDTMASHLLAQGLVKDTFAEAIKLREREFATGLPGANMGVALPHADAQHVNRSAIAVATLKHPVTFRMMGLHEEPIQAEIVFMLALAEGHLHMELLSNLMGIIQNEDALTRIKQAETPQKLVSILSEVM